MNQLAKSSSPYLLQHAGNPVNWQMWSSSTLEEAKRSSKPILVSIGYSTCHWCHVMAHESFEDKLTAEIMNTHFINVKIDREERPDLDHYFMNAVQAMGLQGGWPLHCFLTEEGEPFFGGTYFPPEPKYGRPSWNQVLLSVAQAYQENHREIADQASHLKRHLLEMNQIQPRLSHTAVESGEILKRIKESMDLAEGGFGGSPKFPHTMALQLLGHLYFFTGDKNAISHLSFSLRRMGMGGLFDQLAGGFCRYSVDGYWDVPHFEKMGYDHGQICSCLAFAYGYTGDPFLKMLADRSYLFFEQFMKGPEGLFYAAMDADSEGEEGKYYVWQIEELKALLGSHYEHFASIFETNPLDYLHPDRKVLRLKKAGDNEQLFDKINACLPFLQILQKERDKRIRPSVDSKRIVSWNGMILISYLDWYINTQDPVYFLKAEQLLHAILDLTVDENGNICHYRTDSDRVGFGFLEDYAVIIKACLDYYQISFNKKYYDLAYRFFEYLRVQFSVEGSFLFKMAPGQYSDFNRIQTDWTETNYPSANALLCQCAAYFAEHDGLQEYAILWKGMAEQVKESALRFPLAAASWVGILLKLETGWPVMKASNPDLAGQFRRDLVIPGLFIVPQVSSTDSIQFCFEGSCSIPLGTRDKFVSLLTKFYTRL